MGYCIEKPPSSSSNATSSSTTQANNDTGPELPLPDTILPPDLQQEIGWTTLSDVTMQDWFAPLPMEIWAEFVSHHECMVAARPQDNVVRTAVWIILAKEYQQRRYPSERNVFGSF